MAWKSDLGRCHEWVLAICCFAPICPICRNPRLEMGLATDCRARVADNGLGKMELPLFMSDAGANDGHLIGHCRI
ncbi:hypothetical protein ACLOJK_004173 [Asimina triloba]